MVRTEETTIDGRKVIVVQLPARRALALKTQLISMLGPALVRMLGSIGKPGGTAVTLSAFDRELDLSSAAEALTALCNRLTPDSFFNLVIECMASTRVELDGKIWDVNQASFDVVFSGSLLFMYKVLWFSLKANYADFFGEGGIGGLTLPVSMGTTPVPQQSTQR